MDTFVKKESDASFKLLAEEKDKNAQLTKQSK